MIQLACSAHERKERNRSDVAVVRFIEIGYQHSQKRG
jgi:hypothetical protein